MALRKQKILLGVPIFDGKRYCFDEFAVQIRSFTYPVDILFVDNSADGGAFAKFIRANGFNCIHIERKKKTEIAVMAESHEQLRTHAVKHGYDFLFHLESDILDVPHHAVELMLGARKKIISLLYHIGLGDKSRPMIQLMEPLPADHFKVAFTVQKEAVMFIDGRIKRVAHAGLGCILIHRTVLEKIQFRHVPGQNFHPDTFFAHDCDRFGFAIHIDTGIIVKHQNVAHGLIEI